MILGWTISFMALNKLKGFFTGEEPEVETTGEDSFYNVSKEEYHEQNGVAGSKMMLLEPDQAKRIVDFLYGTIYAIGGSIQKLGGGIFLCTPNNVNVEGKISDESNENVKTVRGKKVEKEDDEDDFF